jgi:hypothetical protein
MAGGGVAGVIEGAAVTPAPGAQQATLVPLPPERLDRRRGQRGPNRNTKAVRDWILRRYDNPLEGMVALALPCDVIQMAEKARALAIALRCTVKEAADLMLKASQAAAPYLNSAMPQDVNLNTKTVTLAIGIGAAPQAGQAGGGLAQLRQAMIAAAGTATPEGAAMLQSVAADLSEENQDNSGL